MQNPHASSSKQCPPSQALDAISGAAFGCICAYIREYGTPYQISRISSLISRLLQKHENKGSTSSSFSSSSSISSGGGGGGDGGRSSSGSSSDVPNWAALRQKVYELCGDWLWMHATNHWRTRVAPKMQIPVVLMDCALKVDAVDGNLGWSVMMPPEDEKQQGGTGGGRLRKSDRRVKKKNEDEMLYLPFADYDFENGEGSFEEGGGAQQDRRGKSKKRQKEVDSGEKGVGNKKRKKNRNSKEVGYNGVLKRQDVEGNVKYYAQIGRKSWNSKLAVGSFGTEEEAAMAVDLAKHLIRKEKTKNKEFVMTYRVSSAALCTAIWKKYDHVYLELRDKFCIFDSELTEPKFLAALRNIISQEVSKWVERRDDDKRNSDGGSNTSNVNDEGAIANMRGDSSQALEMRKRSNEYIIQVAKLSSSPHENNDWIAALYYMILLFSPVEERRQERLRRRRVAILSFRIIHCILSTQARQSSSNKGHSTVVMPLMKLTDYPVNEQMVLISLVKNLKMCDFAEANEARSHGIKQAMVYSLAQCLGFLFDNNKTINISFNPVHFVQEMWMYRQSENNPMAKKTEWQHADDKDFHTDSGNVIPTAINFVGRFYTKVGDYDYSVKDGFVLALNKDFENMKGGEDHETEHDKQMNNNATGEEMPYDVFAKCLERLAEVQGDVEGIKMPLLGSCFMACSI